MSSQLAVPEKYCNFNDTLNDAAQMGLHDLENNPTFGNNDYFARRLITDVQKAALSEKIHFANLVMKWVTAYDCIKSDYLSLLSTESPLNSKQERFNALCAILKGVGEIMLTRLRNNELGQSNNDQFKELFGFSFKDLEACVLEIGDIERSLTAKSSPKHKEALLQKVFRKT
jgi:hypothetical protein